MPGSRLPAHCTSMGRVLLGALPIEQARDIVERADLTPRSPFSLTDPEDIMDQILAAARLGYAVSDQEVETGLRSIAVPIRNIRGTNVAALNTGMAATHSSTGELVSTYLLELQRAQTGIERSFPLSRD